MRVLLDVNLSIITQSEVEEDMFVRKSTLPEGFITTIQEKTALILPESWYYNGQRPSYIQLPSVSTFNLIQGKHNNAAITTAVSEWASDVCTVSIAKKISEHIEISKVDGMYENLGPDDVDSIVSTPIAEAIDTSFSGDIEVLINDDVYTVTLTNGEGSFELNYTDMTSMETMLVAADSQLCTLILNTPDDVKAMAEVRSSRDVLLTATDQLTIRHRDQVDASLATTLTAGEYAELLAYRQSLRDFPSVVDLANIVWPTKPDFV